jgi:CCR4-NOT transcription complex subunit 7/8
MAPPVGRMHNPNMSNPFQHLNTQHSIPQSHYQSQSTHLPNSFNVQHAFGQPSALNGGISPFNPASAYGGSAFTTGGATTFNGGMLQGQGLASEAAQRSFARVAALQEHTAQEAAAALAIKSGSSPRIREVWRHNLDQEMDVLRMLILKYPYVSMDAEFPGIVARPMGNFAGSKAEYHYQTLRANVDLLKPIQLGITLWSPNGELPPQHPVPATLNELMGGRKIPQVVQMGGMLPCTWVFNFHFDLEEDMYAESSIDMLQKQGVDFQRHQQHGIPLNAFGAVLTTSGLTFSQDVNWLSFHSGYDFGYLVKLLTDDALPKKQSDFFDLVRIFFPKLWDIKFLLRDAQRRVQQGRLGVEGTRTLGTLGTKSGLQDLADELGCQRVGTAHTGGSDSWLTGQVFWAMRNKIFAGNLDADLADQIYGLHGVPAPASQQMREDFLAAQGTPQQSTSQAQVNGLQSALQGGAPGYTPNNPSTPTSTHAGLTSSQTPGGQAQQQQHYGHTLNAGSLGQGFGGYNYPGGK